jgi:hypothetical protein
MKACGGAAAAAKIARGMYWMRWLSAGRACFRQVTFERGVEVAVHGAPLLQLRHVAAQNRRHLVLMLPAQHPKCNSANDSHSVCSCPKQGTPACMHACRQRAQVRSRTGACLQKWYSVPSRSSSSSGVCASAANLASPVLNALPANQSSSASGRPSGRPEGNASARTRCFSGHDLRTCAHAHAHALACSSLALSLLLTLGRHHTR